MTISQRSLSRIKNLDWDFPGAFSESKFSAIHWHPGRFASQIPAALIGLLSEPGATVLDPFAGSGTTLVEAQRLGRHAIGIDLNPIACLIAEGKTLQDSAARIERVTSLLLEEARQRLAFAPFRPSRKRPPIPPTVQAEKWYTPDVALALAHLWSIVSTQTDTAAVLGRLAFSATLLPVCRETRHWGYVCDNTEPAGNHEGNVFAHFKSVLDRTVDAYRDRDEEYRARKSPLTAAPPVAVLGGDAVALVPRLQKASVSLVVTSPPYCGVCDYSKAQRLSMEWFGHEIEALRRLEIGARSKRARKEAACQYEQELSAVFTSLRTILRDGGALAMLVGQSSDRAPVLPRIYKLLTAAGFDLAIDVNRRVSSWRRQTPTIHGEHLLVLT